MAWTNTQKQIAARACKAAGIGDEQRRDLVLRHFANARFPDGRISSTSPKLTNADFEQAMAIIEAHAGGQIMHFTRGYWQAAAGDALRRLRFRARRTADELEAAGKLAPGGAGLAGWIEKRVRSAATNRLEELDYPGLMALILGLSAYARRSGVALATAAPEADDRSTGGILNETHIFSATAGGCSASAPELQLHGSLQ